MAHTADSDQTAGFEKVEYRNACFVALNSVSLLLLKPDRNISYHTH